MYSGLRRGRWSWYSNERLDRERFQISNITVRLPVVFNKKIVRVVIISPNSFKMCFNNIFVFCLWFLQWTLKPKCILFYLNYHIAYYVSKYNLLIYTYIYALAINYNGHNMNESSIFTVPMYCTRTDIVFNACTTQWSTARLGRRLFQ